MYVTDEMRRTFGGGELVGLRARHPEVQGDQITLLHDVENLEADVWERLLVTLDQLDLLDDAVGH